MRLLTYFILRMTCYGGQILLWKEQIGAQKRDPSDVMHARGLDLKHNIDPNISMTEESEMQAPDHIIDKQADMHLRMCYSELGVPLFSHYVHLFVLLLYYMYIYMTFSQQEIIFKASLCSRQLRYQPYTSFIKMVTNYYFFPINFSKSSLL